MAKYRKKPVIIDAVQFDGKDNASIIQFISECTFGEPPSKFYKIGVNGKHYIRTIEGDMLMSDKDFLIRGVNGEFYRCKPDIFEKTYELVTT